MPGRRIVSERNGKPSGQYSRANAIEVRERLVPLSGMSPKRAIAGTGDTAIQTPGFIRPGHLIEMATLPIITD